MPLFADKSPDEIDAIPSSVRTSFNAYTERGFDDLPTDMFFAMMGDISETAHVGDGDASCAIISPIFYERADEGAVQT